MNATTKRPTMRKTFVTIWIQTATRGKYAGIPRRGKYETDKLTPTHERIRANYPAKTYTVEWRPGDFCSFIGPTLFETRDWQQADEAARAFNKRTAEQKQQAARMARARVAAAELFERIAKLDGDDAEGVVEVLANALTEYARTGKLDKLTN